MGKINRARVILGGLVASSTFAAEACLITLTRISHGAAKPRSDRCADHHDFQNVEYSCGVIEVGVQEFLDEGIRPGHVPSSHL